MALQALFGALIVRLPMASGRRRDTGRDRQRLRVAAIVLAQSAVTLGSAQTLTCSTWQGIKTCTGPDGYVAHQEHRFDADYGWDNTGRTWTIEHWFDHNSIIVREPK